MVIQTINARYTETYDLNTAVGELSMLAIHTPQAPALKRMFHGFFEQYKKYKINGCDIRMVCASQQTLTPDLIGVEEGQVDPRDVLNPILFKACTGENLNLLLNQIYNDSQSLTRFGDGSIAQHIDTRPVAENIYYQLLADDTFRKSHPQAGITINGLIPMVHKVVTTQPFKFVGYNGKQGPVIGSNVEWFGGPSGSNVDDANQTTASNPNVFVSNGITPMPWLDTAVIARVNKYNVDEEGETDNLIANGQTDEVRMINSVPRCYCGALILPPARLQRLFFRLQISWSISFREWRPSQEFGTLGVHDYAHNPLDGNSLQSGGIGDTTYFNIYHSASPSAKGDAGDFGKEVSSFTTTEGTEVESIMEQGN